MSQLTFVKNTQGRILYELTNKWIGYKKHYFRICRVEKLRDLSWKEIENHKYEEEATPPSNELCDLHAIFSMNPQSFVRMINISNYKKIHFRKPQAYHNNFN
jgi:ribulose bisphosphate carboxylase small subunit